MSDEDTETGKLRREQLRRELAEAKQAGSAADAEEFAQHQRRADKAHYLRKKLEEREASETEG